MIINLETERQNGLDEAKLAANVMRLIDYSESNVEPYDEDDLIEWLGEKGFIIHFYWRSRGSVEIREIKHGQPDFKQRWVEVSFIKVADFPLALALAAVRLLGEKQDG